MCQVANFIASTRDLHREQAQTIENWEAIELQMHLAIEAEKYLRRHEARCDECKRAQAIA